MNLPTLRLEAITQLSLQVAPPVEAWQVAHALGQGYRLSIPITGTRLTDRVEIVFYEVA